MDPESEPAQGGCYCALGTICWSHMSHGGVLSAGFYLYRVLYQVDTWRRVYKEGALFSFHSSQFCISQSCISVTLQCILVILRSTSAEQYLQLHKKKGNMFQTLSLSYITMCISQNINIYQTTLRFTSHSFQLWCIVALLLQNTNVTVEEWNVACFVIFPKINPSCLLKESQKYSKDNRDQSKLKTAADSHSASLNS